MCTPTSHNPSFSLRMESASSKSLASFGSMVKVVTLRKSSRLAISSAEISAGILSAAVSTAFGYTYGRPNSARIACISVVLSPAWPNISITCPIGFLALSGHSVTFTMALSPVLPPFSLSFGMKISLASVRFSVTRNAYDLATSSVPTKVSFARSSISITSPSASLFFRLA